jgi:hypothetical protein
VGIHFDAPSPVDLTAEIEEHVRHAGVAGQTGRRHHLQAVEGEVVRRPEPHVEDADPGVEPLRPREVPVRIEELREHRPEGLREHVDPRDGHPPRAVARLELHLVVALQLPAQGRAMRLDVLTARCRTVSCRWWRRRWPVTRSW